MHLIRRFFGFLRARPLTPLEQHHVRSLLEPDLARVFFAQRPEDQRHALSVQQRIGNTQPLAEAALLHDVGKTDSNLGAFSRSAATIWDGIGLPTIGSWSHYLNHGTIGGELLGDLGATDFTVAFTHFHPGPAPTGINPREWMLLEEADNA